jgi:ring-1,2-phenylacetyl-CoA epoxidase subunit PaaE
MVADAQEVLAGFEVPDAQVHRELFYVDAPPPAPVRADDGEAAREGIPATVILNGRTTTTTLPPDTAVLDAAQRVRSDLPFACRGGVCGTCRARVTSGEVVMRRNFALEADEVAAGYVLTCQSVPVAGDLVVDYDV